MTMTVKQETLNNAFYATADLLKETHGYVSLKLFRKFLRDEIALATPEQVNIAEFITFNKFTVDVDI